MSLAVVLIRLSALILLPPLLLARSGRAEQPPWLIEEIRIEENVEKKVGVFIKLDGFIEPHCFPLSGEQQRLVCDFDGTTIAEDIEPSMEATGDMLLRVRIGRHSKPLRKTRLVLDLNPERNYNVDQMFVEATNEFVLIVSVSADSEEPGP